MSRMVSLISGEHAPPLTQSFSRSNAPRSGRIAGRSASFYLTDTERRRKRPDAERRNEWESGRHPTPESDPSFPGSLPSG